MSNYVLSVSSLPRYQLGRPQQSSIQQILRLGYLQESNRTQLSGTILSKKINGVSCWGLGAGQAHAKQGDADAALEAMLLSATSLYLVAVLVKGTTEDLRSESLLCSAAPILVHSKHAHDDLSHHHSNPNDQVYPPLYRAVSHQNHP